MGTLGGVVLRRQRRGLESDSLTRLGNLGPEKVTREFIKKISPTPGTEAWKHIRTRGRGLAPTQLGLVSEMKGVQGLGAWRWRSKCQMSKGWGLIAHGESGNSQADAPCQAYKGGDSSLS